MDDATGATRGEGGVAVRRLILALAAASATGCAQPGLPPGGAVDTTSPAAVRVRPDSQAVNVRADGITFQFNEVVSERPQGVTSLAELFLISPSFGENRVSWRRTSVTVSPRGGLQSGTTYTVRMLPGLTDLEGNVDSLGALVVFSTGPAVARSHVRGIVFDWVEEKVGESALIEAFPLPASRDSVRYLAVADSVGRFDLANLPPGRYFLRAVIDANTNRLLEPRELYDSATVTVGDSLRREMLAIVRDTLGPGIQTVTITDSMTLTVALDHVVDTAQAITPALFSLTAADSSVVPIVSVAAARDVERAKQDSIRLKAQRDSVQRDSVMADSLRRRVTQRADTTPARAVPRTQPVPRPRRGVPTAAGVVPGRDTVKVDSLPKPSVRPPVSEFVLRLGAPLKAGSAYRLRSDSIRSFLGYTRSALRSFTVPRASTSADSTAADSAARRDTSVRDTLVRDTLVRDTLVRDTLVRDTLVRDTLVRDTLVQDTLVRDTIQAGDVVPTNPASAVRPTRLPPQPHRRPVTPFAAAKRERWWAE